MVDINKRVKKVLEQGYLISLGTVDDGGVWVADVIYVHDDDFNIYWMSSPGFRHSTAILNNNNVAGAITVSQAPGEKDFGLQVSGCARKIGKVISPNIAIRYLKKKKKFELEDIGKVLRDGYDWYVLEPTKIELIDQENFGFDKNDITLR